MKDLPFHGDHPCRLWEKSHAKGYTKIKRKSTRDGTSAGRTKTWEGPECYFDLLSRIPFRSMIVFWSETITETLSESLSTYR